MLLLLRCALLALLLFFAAPLPAQSAPSSTDLALACERWRVADLDRLRVAMAQASSAYEQTLVMRAAGRIGNPSLVPLVAEWLAADALAWSDPRLQEAAAVSVGLLATPPLLVPLAERVDAPLLALAAAGVGELPAAEGGEGHHPVVLAALGLDRSDPDPEVIVRMARVANFDLQGHPAMLNWLKFGVPSPRSGMRDVSSQPNDPRVRALLYWLARSERADLTDRALQKTLLHVITQGSDWSASLLAAKAVCRADEVLDELTRGLLIGLAGARSASGLRSALLIHLSEKGEMTTDQLSHLERWLVDVDPQTRAAATRALSAAPSSELRRKLLDKSSRDPVGVVRVAAGHVWAKQTPQRLLQKRAEWRLSDDWQLLSGLAQELGARGLRGERALLAPIFRDLLHHPDRRVRLACLLGSVDTADQADPLRTALILGGLLEPAAAAPASPRSGPGAPRGPQAGDPISSAQLLRYLLAMQEAARTSSAPADPGFDVAKVATTLLDSIPHGDLEAMQAAIDATRLLSSDVAMTWLTEVVQDPAQAARPALIAQALNEITKRDAERGATLGAMNHAWRVAGMERELAGRQRSALPPETPLNDFAAWVPRLAPWAPRLVTIHTTRGELKVEFFADEAPQTVANFERLARQGWYDGLRFHRVVPNFVVQMGCPRGDGWGGPAATIPCEINARPYRRGTLGMALAGKDTGGSQWFFCLQPQPHLDLRYTVFGELVGPEDLKVLDAITTDDKIISIKLSPPAGK